MQTKHKIVIYFGMVLTYFAAKMIISLEIFKVVPEIVPSGCEAIKAPKGGEDAIVFKNTVVFGSNDLMKMKHPLFGPLKMTDGQLFAIKEGARHTYEVQIIGFPQGIAFHPHGMYLRESMLYVINHAYSKGGERVEIFELFENEKQIVSAFYVKSFVFGKNFNGIFNDLVVVGEDEYFMTQWLPFAEGENGPKNDFIGRANFLLPLIIGLKKTQIYYCKSENCVPVKSIMAGMFNGIDWNGKDAIYAASTTNKEVYEFIYDKENPRNLALKQTYKFGFNTDNVFYDREKNELLVGCLGKVAQVLNFEAKVNKDLSVRPDGLDFYSGYQSLNLETKSISLKLMQKNFIYAVSSAIRMKDKVYIGTFADDRILVCNA